MKHSLSRKISSAFITTALTVFSFHVQAQDGVTSNSDLKPTPRVDYTKSKILSEQAEFAEVLRETEEADAASYDTAARAAAAEELKLQKELVKVEEDIKAVKEAKERSKIQAAQAQKQLQAQAAKNIEAKKRLKAMNNEKVAEEKRLEDIRGNLAKADAEDKSLQEDSRKLESFMKMAQEERASIAERILKIKTAVTQERQRQMARQAQYNLYRQKNKEYETRVSTIEGRRAQIPPDQASSSGNRAPSGR